MTAVFFLLISWCMVRAKTRRQVLAIALVGPTAVVLVGQPSRAYAQSLVAEIEAVLNVINGIIQIALNGVNTVRSAVSSFYQTVAWPTQLINAAKALVSQMISQYRGLMRSIFNINLTSATLPGSQALESVIRNQQVNDFSALSTNYGTVYGPLPASGAASPEDRTMTDMDDALAKDNLKTIKETDDAGQTTLDIADRIEDAASQAAPGSAPYLTATAVATSIQSQALTQKMIAAELRQEAGRLAHSNALRKRGATYAGQFSHSIQKMLQPRWKP
jgi:hypothetical protein